MSEKTLTIAAIARLLGMDAQRVRRAAHRLGLGTALWDRPRAPREYEPEDVEKIAKYIAAHKVGRPRKDVTK
jgi:hypothetical protein